MAYVNLIRIDGSHGEGGGQILRTSLSMSMVLGVPVEVYNIRSKRSRPGLKPQHLQTLKALAEIGNAKVEGLFIGSTRIRFSPRGVRPGSYRFDIGTAGSVTLMLQAIIPALSLSGAECELEIVGGTDVKWSPTSNYFKLVFLKALKRIGIDVDFEIKRRGYYPRGGGIVKVRVKSGKLRALNLLEVNPSDPFVLSVCSNLPRSVAERQAKSAVRILKDQGVRVKGSEAIVEPASSPGTSILVYSVEEDGPFIGSDQVGEKGKPAELVGREAAEGYLEEYREMATVDSHLADMLSTYLSLTERESEFRTSKVSEHLKTNLYVSRLFTGCEYELSEIEGGVLVRIRKT